MSPRWLFCSACLILVALTPAPVAPQIILRTVRTVVCSLCNGAYIALGCGTELQTTQPCNLLSFKITFLCRTYPCQVDGFPPYRTCEAPADCPFWQVRPLGLCGLNAVCCGSLLFPREIDNTAQAARSTFKGSRSRSSTLKSVLSKLRFGFRKTNEQAEDVSTTQNETALSLPSTPMDYVKDWLQDNKNPSVLEGTIKRQYEQFVKEINAINRQEQEQGTQETALKAPSFEEFRSAALGETSAQ